MTETRRPLHLGAYLGLSAGAYAVGLAVVTALEAQAEAAVVADRTSTSSAVEQLAASNDRLETRARLVARTYDEAAGAYDRLGIELVDLESRLADLADVVGTVNGVALALPDRVSLPRVSRAAAPATRPQVHATTAASGG
jgi:hypothetical protein